MTPPPLFRWTPPLRRARNLSFALLIGLIAAEMLLWDALDEHRTYAELSAVLFEAGYPIRASDYLPLTVPPSTQSEAAAAAGVNNFGYRGSAPLTRAKPAGVQRVLLLGDGFTAGAGVPAEATFAAQLQAALGSGYEIINAGYRAGYSPDAYYAYWQREGAGLTPDWVIINLYSPSSLDDLAANRWLQTDASGAPLVVETLRHYRDDRFNLHNPATLPLYYRLPLLRESRLFIALGDTLTSARDPVPLPPAEAAARLTLALRALDAAVRAAGGRLALVVFDSAEAGIQEARLTAALAAALPAAQWVDWRGAFRAEENRLPGQVYFSARGHERYASALRAAFWAP